MSRIVLVITMVVSLPVLPAQPRQVREAWSGRSGTASISGQVLEDAPGNAPLARAVVTIMGAAVGDGISVVTDETGRFTISGLPSGRVTLTASKPGYLTMAYGQGTPDVGSGLPIALKNGEAVADLAWRLPPAAVISGRILDQHGRPMRGAVVVLMHYRMISNKKELRAVTGFIWPRTDSAGAYRVYGISPGEYIVSALPFGSYALLGGGAVVGRSTKARIVTDREVRWAQAELASSGAGVPGSGGGAEPPEGPRVAYGRVYYPGVHDSNDARPISVGVGEERTGVNFSIQLQPTARVEAQVVGLDGPAPDDTQILFSVDGGTSRRRASTFSAENLVPGRYTISAVGGRGRLFASKTFTLSGGDRTDIVLVLQVRPTVSGHIVVLGKLGRKPPTGISVFLTPQPPMTRATPVDADGAFELSVDPGRYRLNARTTGPKGQRPWVLESAMLDGRDVSDLSFEVVAGERVSGIVVTISDQPTTLLGHLLDAAGRPASGYYVVAFATDSSLWEYGSRRLPPAAVTDTDGSFRFVGLPAGQYYLSALTSVAGLDLSDGDTLRQLAASATAVNLAQGEQKQLDLKFACPTPAIGCGLDTR